MDDVFAEIPFAIRGDKVALRRWAKARRANLDLPFLSRLLTRRLQALPEISGEKTCALYLAMPDEFAVDELANVHDAISGVRWYAPRCLPGRKLGFYRYRPGETILEISRFGVREPATENAIPLSPEAFDVVIVPALLLTAQGVRLGYGGGYYDRFLPQLRPDCVTIGVLPSALVVRDLPQDSWDIPLQMVVTEREVYRTG
jgi:5-formyltetrahydrofolate cyclo-ligase